MPRTAPVAPASPADLRLPTEQMKKANNLRRLQGLSDAEIGDVLGCSREWACKLRAEYRRRANRLLSLSAAGCEAALLPALLN